MLLQCHVNQKRYERELIEVDSLYNAATAELASLKGRFELVREGKEQTLANYVYKGTRTKGEVKRSELRVQVTEKGDLQLTSVYYGTSKLVTRPVTMWWKWLLTTWRSARTWWS